MDVMVSITGYGGERTTLLATIDPATGVLVIVKNIRFREVADAGYAFVTNTRTESYDCLFTEEHWADAIREYQVAEGTETLKLSEATQRYKPRIETDGVGEGGQKYRLHAELINGEVAVLALAHFHQRQRAIATGADALDEWCDLVMI
ncbi:hypothetical protein [Pseudomonas gingeri]|uniref:hypothetical protein n=1 Tax=Pseudomonas gingeri TaxID=117681 RepID=UPI0015A16617|nr:hypothetical protein [Pseudomonas gingeri]NWA11931.1 hypothetical protein [Pseudomonas gingeri]